MKNSKVAEKLESQLTDDIKIYSDKLADIILRVNSILKKKGYTQKQLAENLDKQPSEISKWLSGNHNFTLKSLAKLEAELGEEIITVPVYEESEKQVKKVSDKGEDYDQ